MRVYGGELYKSNVRSNSLGSQLLWLLLLLTFVGSVAARHAVAQSTTEGAIAGTVFDPSGAVVPSANVTVHNNGTNAEHTASADSSGYYRVGALPPAIYTVTVTASGFQTFKSEQVTVHVGAITEVSAHLVVGAVGQEVVVTATAAQVNTASPDFAPVVNQTSITNLPINGGRWSDFALLTPGVVNTSAGFGLIAFRGISSLLNNNTIDGADNNQAFFSEERGRTRMGYSSPKAAVQEFQVNTSNYSAEYGRSAGGVINTVTKSGTNNLHGEAYFFDRDNKWGSRNPFTTITTQASPGVYTTAPYKPVDVRKMWGFGVGGPIKKDKLFWFLAFDRFHHNFPGTSVASNPNAFYAAPTCPTTKTSGSPPCVSGSTIYTLAQRLFATSTPTVAQQTTAQTDYNNGLAGLLSENGPVPRTGDQDILFPKLDWQINEKNRLSMSFNRVRWWSPAGIQTQATNTYAIRSFGNDYVADTWGVATLDTLLSPTLSNEVRYQYGRDFEWENPQGATAYEQANFMTSPNFPNYSNPLGYPPDVFITNGFDMGTATFLTRPAYPDERRHQLADTVTWVRGNHTFKFGADYTHVHELAENLRYQFGSFSYTSVLNYVSDLYKPGSCGSKFNTNCYSSYQQAFGPLGFAFGTNDLAFFVEDAWKIKPRFTLNFGLRYEHEILPKPFLANSALPQTAVLPDDKTDFGPRVGFAWDILGDGKTSLRGGYGMYYGRVINSAIYNALINTGNPGGQFSDFFTASTGPAFPQVLASGPVSAAGLVYYDTNFKLPLIHETDLTLERNVGWSTIVSVSYLGSYGRRLPDFVDTNISPATKTITYTVTNGGPIASPTYTTELFTGPRPNPAFGSLTKIFSGLNSNYNALVIDVKHRLSHNVQFDANYTWSHALDYGENESTFTDTNDLLDPFNIKAEYGNSIYNVPNRFVFHAVANAPWHVSGPAGWFANGWELAPIYQAQNGLPYSLVTSGSAPGGLAGSINGSNGRKGIDILGRNTFRLPSTQVVDLRLSKKFTYKERYTVEILAEGFNLFNRFNATGVNNTGYIITTSNVTTPSGVVTCSSSAPCLNYNVSSSTFAPLFRTITSANSNFAYSTRQVQLGARILF